MVRSARANGIAIVIANATCACVSISHVEPADTLGRKVFQVGVESGLQRVPSPYLPYFPFGNSSFRYGLTDTTDVGIRVGYSGLEAHGKFLLTEPSDPKLAISVVPAVGGGWFPGTSGWIAVVNSSVTVLAGIPHLRVNELVGGVRVGSRIMMAPERDGELEVGVSLGYSLRIGEHVGLMPELAIALPVIESSGASANLNTPSPNAPATFANHFIAQFSLGMSFGRQRRR